VESTPGIGSVFTVTLNRKGRTATDGQ
jgi:hypothetical protein